VHVMRAFGLQKAQAWGIEFNWACSPSSETREELKPTLYCIHSQSFQHA